MQFETSTRSTRQHILSAVRNPKHSKLNESNLTMYTRLPDEEISLMEFKEIAIRRLKVLKVVEDARERYSKNSEEYTDAMYKGLSKLMPLACGLCAPENVETERRWDCISHLILRLAYCRTPEQTKWFLQNELDLFAFRFKREMKNRSMVAKFLDENDFTVEELSAAEKDELCHCLSGASEISAQKARCIQYWRVPFTDALELVRKRKVYLRNGFAFVSENDFVVIVSARFRMMMSAAMAQACKYIDFLGEEDRLVPFLKKLASKNYIGKSYTGNEKDLNRVSPEMIDKLAIESFPLCMRYIHHRLKLDHHLRHGARMQYGLFLKGIGLSLEDALTFWRTEFTKKMDSEKFDKQYAYNIRHNYGKEGRRVEYSSYSCQKIILSNAPTALDCHGCPYRHCDSQILSQRLEGVGMTKDYIDKIINLSKDARYDRACTAYFEYMHKLSENSVDTVITHPNQYFELSTQLRDGSRNSVGSKYAVLLTASGDARNCDDEEMVDLSNALD